MAKDISPHMKFIGKKIAVCQHYCKDKARNANFYSWHTYFNNTFIREMCEHCALRETWGYNYKQTKGYKRWIG